MGQCQRYHVHVLEEWKREIGGKKITNKTTRIFLKEKNTESRIRQNKCQEKYR